VCPAFFVPINGLTKGIKLLFCARRIVGRIKRRNRTVLIQ